MGTQFLVGTSGFSYAHWRGVFYLKGMAQTRWLQHYARHFPTVELNGTFYRLPSEKTVQAWRDKTPPGFLFAVKASRFITHIRRLENAADPLSTFLDRLALLNDKLGPVLYQLPPTMAKDLAVLEAFLRLLPQKQQHVLEFRHPSWYSDDTYDVLKRCNAALCIHDMPKSESPVLTTTDFAYVRFHGPQARYAGRYPDSALQDWARQLKDLNAVCAYVYFNNDTGGHAVNSARTLTALLD